MRPGLFVLSLLSTGLVLTTLPRRAEAAPEARPSERDNLAELRPFLEKYCVECHGDKKTKGGVNLAKALTEEDIWKHQADWRDALENIRTEEMPPDDFKNQPAKADRAKAVAWLNGSFQRLEQLRDPGRVTIRRLTRREYNNTIRDLFGLDLKPAENFPADGGGGAGFDNNADTLFIPDLLLEEYLKAAHSVMDAVLADPAAKARFLKAEPSAALPEKEAARRTLAGLLPYAFRRPLAEGEMERFLAVQTRARQAGRDYPQSLKLAAVAALVSPEFLFRRERTETGSGYRALDSWEMAARLSYFLWNTLPDNELLGLARAGKLQDETVLSAQVKRMLKDPKARSMTEDFASQWLGFSQLDTAYFPNHGTFPDYYKNNLKEAFKQEASLFFDHIVRQNRPLTELISCNYSFLNDNLARHYGLPEVKGEEFRKVEFNDPRRGGVLGMGAVHVQTAYPHRTSPVLRGKFVLDVIMGTPPPPPPPNVLSLDTNNAAAKAQNQTVRERLESHRSKAECKGCHARLDPPGFALEGYDVIGRWREQDNGKPIDSNGVLPDGTKVDGPASLRAALLAKKELFVRNLAQRFLAYALGRGVEYNDEAALRQIVARTMAAGGNSENLVLEVVKSLPFRNVRRQ